jgi:protein-S-isoprenylcysteine O-methyltransferase Ste14
MEIGPSMRSTILLKSLAHNLGVLIVGFGFACACRAVDLLWHRPPFHSAPTIILGALLLAVGFLIRVWATFDFYQRQMKVVRLEPQAQLVTTGAYRFTRNPLYLGGNVFIFFGAVLVLGSTSGIIFTAANIVAVDFMIRREERQLAARFGDAWTAYKHRVRRWV